MTNRMFTSFKFSKLLYDNNCNLDSKEFYHDDKCRYCIDDQMFNVIIYCRPKAYDIVYDICIKYYDKFFNVKRPKEPTDIYENCKYCKDIWFDISKTCNYCKEKDNEYSNAIFSYKEHSQKILDMLQQDKPQEEIELYIEDNCVFLKKGNK